MNSTQKLERESDWPGRASPTMIGEGDTPPNDPDALTPAGLRRQLTECAAEFAAVHAALQREQEQRQRWEKEAHELSIIVAHSVAEAARLAAQLREKETLLREMHHRINNNLQVIISLFHLQLDRLSEPRTRAMFLECQNRVYAMSLIHEKLYRSHGQAAVEFAEYVRGLTTYVFRSYGVDSDRIRLAVDADGIDISIETMIPCGLILNELVSNALKYAFPGERAGDIGVRLRKLGERSYELTVHDDGVGIPPGMDVHNTNSVGMQIVHALCEQLEGTLAVSRSPGTTVTIAFREQSAKRKL